MVRGKAVYSDYSDANDTGQNVAGIEVLPKQKVLVAQTRALSSVLRSQRISLRKKVHHVVPSSVVQRPVAQNARHVQKITHAPGSRLRPKKGKERRDSRDQ